MSEKQYLAEFIKQLRLYDDESSLRSFLEAILTPKELEEIPKRLQIVKMLKQGIPQREISENLGVGIATVTRGSKEVNKGNFQDIA
ncbi:trp operon repressor [Candidatus Woesebacteria bacterium]|nr:trp operon repressor [Candidatus Woesebacteria bacterium]MCD8526634.1 trp operon repressor [Candidatus Woesebacteria bacterium]MCD8546031.1 trp operon repressor [Candidatus Woesebacteria bacterium]